MRPKRLLEACFPLVVALPLAAGAQSPVPAPSARAILRAPPLFQPQPDPQNPGRFLGFTASGCAVSFAQSAVRGLTWTGDCRAGRIDGHGVLIGYDYEQQPLFHYEGFAERGMRTNGTMHEVARRQGVLAGQRTAFADRQLSAPLDIAFLEMPRAFLLALDDWSRQTDGKDLLASMGVSWARGYRAPTAVSQDRSPPGMASLQVAQPPARPSGSVAAGSGNSDRVPPRAATEPATTARQKMPEGHITELCVKFRPLQRDGNASWFEFHNGCNEPINVRYGNKGTGVFGSMASLRPGQSSKSWYLNTRYDGVTYYACRQQVNGQDVHADQKTNQCYYWNR